MQLSRARRLSSERTMYHKLRERENEKNDLSQIDQNRSRIRILATKFAIGESIAAKLNVRNVRTARGGTWTHVQVGRSSALSTQAWPREAQEAVMATWVKVTTESGEST
jgi:hypothetical protein